MPEGTEPQAAPQFDMEAMAQRIAADAQRAAAAGTQQAIDRATAAANQRQQQHERQQQQERTQADPVASTILNTVGPALRELAIKGDSGRDAAVFYTTTPAAGRFSGVIEGRFNDLLARGIPVDRASIWNLIKGEQGLTHDGITFEEQIKRRDEEVKRAEEAATIRGSRGGAPSQMIRDARAMSPEDLETALDNVAF
jgi:hypothetical protein